MVLSDLSPEEILSGSMGLLFVIASFIIGIRLILKYIPSKQLHKQRALITAGLTWIFVGSGWWPRSISIITITFSDFTITGNLYRIIANLFLPLSVVCWAFTMSELLYIDYKKIVNLSAIIFAIVWELFLFTQIIIDPDLIGRVECFYYQPGITSIVFISIALCFLFSTGFHFSIMSMRMGDKKIIWKGRFLMLAFISFSVAAIIEGVAEITPLELVFVRILLIISAFEYYLGFFLPPKLAKFLIKDWNNG
ncbi:MAG: hypothetical protein ACTSR8_19300 [Promethearchaeota archaeon]